VYILIIKIRPSQQFSANTIPSKEGWKTVSVHLNLQQQQFIIYGNISMKLTEEKLSG
jgi:hypothetical protein